MTWVNSDVGDETAPTTGTPQSAGVVVGVGGGCAAVAVRVGEGGGVRVG